MLTLADLIDFTGLSEAEILAIAEHEHIPEVAACSFAQYLSQDLAGEAAIRDMIIDDIRTAQGSGRVSHVRELLHVLHHFLREHPEARPETHPWSTVFTSVRGDFR